MLYYFEKFFILYNVLFILYKCKLSLKISILGYENISVDR